MAMLAESDGCPEPLERIFRQVELESERRAEEEQMRAARLASLDDATMKKVKARRRGSISISRLGHFATEEKPASPQGSLPTTPKGLVSLASSSPFYQKQIANASASSIASGASAFSDDDAHTEDADQVIQVHQIAPKQSIATKIIPRRLSRARSTQMYPAGEANIDVSVSETTIHSTSRASGEEETTPSRRASVSAQRSLRSQPSLGAIREQAGDEAASSSWVARLTKKLKRKSKQDPLSPSSPAFPR
ncbi:hypothetical protein D9611_003682 [Ephemerocybe angulata]|uniref:Uncharacterized protein n=1 Tax=Ephemerocybe angulata TaxID=980116 RepID=A0A8H5B5F4_9AGAR|nr:hypothetical protein D9611_003682 [Tulosesus angulatus]